MPRLSTLQDLAGELDRDPSLCRPLCPELWLKDPDENKRVLFYLVRSAQSFHRGEKQTAYQQLLEARKTFRFLPLPLIFNIAWLSRQLGREQSAAHECLRFAEGAFHQQYFDLGCEAASAALILDALGEYEITGNPALSSQVACWYERAAQSMNRPPSPESVCRDSPPLKVGILTPNLVDHVVAYSKRVLTLARYADATKYRLFVYSSENHACRKGPLFPFGCVDSGSAGRGVETMAELARRGIPVRLGPNNLRTRASADWLARRMEADALDILIVQSGLSAPIDWLTARICRAPVKASLHIGSSLFLPGMDVSYYANAVNIERETPWWPDKFGERKAMRPCVDIGELESASALSRENLAIPAHSVLLGVLGNHLDRRLSVPYMTALAELLRLHPEAWFVAMGSGYLPDKLAFFHSQGVASRIRFTGSQCAAGSALKMLDIYANEFPVGGSQSVCEAMTCGIPVLAMHWSDLHPECAGARLVGDPLAITARDESSYVRLASSWIENATERKAAGRLLRERALWHFSAEGSVGGLLDDLQRYFRQKITTPLRGVFAPCFDCAAT
ncbi:MAG: hypothetical protein V2A34_04955 [Lentisphaerota bacterium]